MRVSKVFMSLVLLVFNIFAVCGQSSTRTVSGEVVYAEDGTPVAGASIQIEGTKIGGFTDMNGRFAIDKVPATAKYAIFNFLGTKEKKVPISNEMKVSLESDSEVLESVVVTGMQKMDKRLFTG
ncbi:MAG: carboxypeptidase-like regulatory domain-containing protein, partial [Bacteroidales bacterium]|nr:carboxypeptidase-like regulatory domain-containing protein [Bacteroidales bacterium]